MNESFRPILYSDSLKIFSLNESLTKHVTSTYVKNAKSSNMTFIVYDDIHFGLFLKVPYVIIEVIIEYVIIEVKISKK